MGWQSQTHSAALSSYCRTKEASSFLIHVPLRCQFRGTESSAGFAGKDLVLHIKGTQETAEPGLSPILPSRGLEMEWVWDNHVRTVMGKVRELQTCPSDLTVLLHVAQQPQAATVLWLAKGSSVYGLIFIGILLIINANLNI